MLESKIQTQIPVNVKKVTNCDMELTILFHCRKNRNFESFS